MQVCGEHQWGSTADPFCGNQFYYLTCRSDRKKRWIAGGLFTTLYCIASERQTTWRFGNKLSWPASLIAAECDHFRSFRCILKTYNVHVHMIRKIPFINPVATMHSKNLLRFHSFISSAYPTSHLFGEVAITESRILSEQKDEWTTSHLEGNGYSATTVSFSWQFGLDSFVFFLTLATWCIMHVRRDINLLCRHYACGYVYYFCVCEHVTVSDCIELVRRWVVFMWSLAVITPQHTHVHKQLLQGSNYMTNEPRLPKVAAQSQCLTLLAPFILEDCFKMVCMQSIHCILFMLCWIKGQMV